MKDFTKYQGIFPAFYACYDDAGAISPERVRAFTQYLIDKGVTGLYVGGSSGECIYQSVAERKLLLENVMEVARGKITIIAHVACNNTNESRQLAAHAEAQGVDAIASIPPIYFRLPDHAVAQYWNDISAAAPNTDFVIYNIPQLAGVALSEKLYREMRRNPRVIGVKNSSMPAMDIERFKHAGGEDSIVFNGPDEQFVSGRAIGADGGIGGTYGAMPELFLKMDALIREGDWATARRIQADVNDIIAALCSGRGSMYAVIKKVIEVREGLRLGGVRAPMPNLSDGDDAVVADCAARIDAAIARWC